MFLRDIFKGAKARISSKAVRDKALNIMESCKKGSVVVINYGKGSHSALLLHHPVTRVPIYLSYPRYTLPKGEEMSCIRFLFSNYEEREKKCFEHEERVYKELSDDIIRTCSMPIQTITLEGMDIERIIQAVRANQSKKFNFLTQNCSRFIADLLLSSFSKDIKFTHDKTWQMPYNTVNLALEIEAYLEKNKKKMKKK